jgi:hypothetical protein
VTAEPGDETLLPRRAEARKAGASQAALGSSKQLLPLEEEPKEDVLPAEAGSTELSHQLAAVEQRDARALMAAAV